MNKFLSIEKLLIGYSIVAAHRTFGAPGVTALDTIAATTTLV